MANSVSKSQNNSIKMYIFTSIPLIFILSSVFHFAYDALGKWTYLAIVFPKSESVFEHLKLAIYPTLIVWILGYIILSKRKNIDIKKWIIALTFSIALNIITILSLFYIGTAGLNIKSMLYDISTIIVGTILGQFVAMHVYNYSKNNNKKLSYAYTILLIIIFLATFFTFSPAKLPIFFDPISKTFG